MEVLHDSQDPVLNNVLFMLIAGEIVGGDCFIRSDWGQSVCHNGAEIKQGREQKLQGLQVVKQLNWKYEPPTHTFPSLCGLIPEDVKLKLVLRIGFDHEFYIRWWISGDYQERKRKNGFIVQF